MGGFEATALGDVVDVEVDAVHGERTELGIGEIYDALREIIEICTWTGGFDQGTDALILLVEA